MKWYKLFLHDVRRGLLRWRYVLIPVVIAVPCLEYVSWVSAVKLPGSWIDLIFYIFKGQEPIEISSLPSAMQYPIPTVWLFIMGACLYLNLDYFFYDLSLTGQQIIIRCGTRRGWFLSKCIWNLLSTVLYFLMIGTTALLFACCLGSAVSMKSTPEMLQAFLGLFDSVEISVLQALITGILVPFLTLAALNLLQMTLCLFVKPIISFLICAGILLLSIYIPEGFILGNGAMTIRSSIFSISGLASGPEIVAACMVMFLCVAVGTLWFCRMDILPKED